MMQGVTVHLEEEERQMILLAMAKLSVERPGWLDMIEGLAMKMDDANEQGKPRMLCEFRRIHQLLGPSLELALAKSLTLQSHYAKLLNMHDGGERRPFATVEEWVQRLIEIGEMPGVEARP